MPPTRECSKCFITLDLSMFYKRGDGKPFSLCKSCASKANKERLLSVQDVCKVCGGIKPLSEFPSSMRSKKITAKACSVCYDKLKEDSRQQELLKKATAVDSQNIRLRWNNQRKRFTLSYKDREKASQKEKVRRRASMLIAYLKDNPCVECGESDPVVLDFDHIDPSTKLMKISDSIWGRNWDKILKEIEKCQVLCANCHRRKTAKEGGWIKHALSCSADIEHGSKTDA